MTAIAGFGGYYYARGVLGVEPSQGSPMLYMSAFAERRVGKRIWLLARLEGSTTSYDAKVDSALPETGTSDLGVSSSYRINSGSVFAGARGVLNPGGAVEVSIFGGASVGYRTTASEREALSLHPTQPPVRRRAVTSSDGFSLAGTAGFMLEKSLMKNLSLRFSTPVLTAFWARSSGSEESFADGTSTGPAVEQSDSSLVAGVSLVPSLELRMEF